MEIAFIIYQQGLEIGESTYSLRTIEKINGNNQHPLRSTHNPLQNHQFVYPTSVSFHCFHDHTIQSIIAMSSDIGIYGLTNQGVNLALNFASNGFLVTVGNKSSDKVRSFCCVC